MDIKETKEILRTPEELSYLNDNINKLDLLRFKFQEKKAEWIKQILIVLIAFLSMIVTFGDKEIKGCINVFFVTSLCCVGMTLVFGIVSLYRQVALVRLYVLFQEESLQRRLNKETANRLSGDVSTKNIYTISEYIFCIMSCISLLSMVVYGVA